MLEHLAVSLAGPQPEVQLTARTPSEATITLYYFQLMLHTEKLFEGELPAGITELPLRHKRLFPDILYHVVAQLPDGEVRTHRFTLPGAK